MIVQPRVPAHWRIARRHAPLFLVAPAYTGLQDVVSGAVGALQTGGILEAEATGQALRSTATNSTAGARWAYNNRLNALTDQYTILVYARITALGADGALLAISNTGNEIGLSLRRYSTTSQLCLSWDNSSKNSPGASGGLATSDGWSLYTVTKAANVVTFYRDNTAYGVNDYAGSVNFSSPLHVSLLNPGSTSWINGNEGYLGLAAILPYPLSGAEVAALAANPFALFEPIAMPRYVVPASPPPPPPPPYAAMQASDISGYAPLAVKFTNLSTGDVTSIAWDADGNGVTDSTVSPYTHTYNTPGTYTARLTATGPGGSSQATQAINVYAVPPVPSVTGLEYTVELDTTRTNFESISPINDLHGRTVAMKWAMGMKDPFGDFAPPSTMNLELDNDDGAFNVEKPDALYRDRIVTGMLIRVKVKHLTGTYQLWEGKVSSIKIAPGSVTNARGKHRRVLLTAECPTQRLLDAEYSPPLMQKVRTDTVLYHIFSDPVVPYPYDRSWWVLGVNRLDPDALDHAQLYQNLIFTAEPGLTVLDFVGDMGGTERGGRAQTVLRDVVAGESGGRFFWDGRAGLFRFHNRQHDASAVVKIDMSADSYLTGVDATYSDRIANVVTVKFKPRVVGSADSILWEQKDFILRGSEREKTLNARFSDPDNPDAKVGALRVEPIAPSVDIVARIDWTLDISGNKVGGLQVGHALYATVESTGSSAKVTLVNSFGEDVQIDSIRLRGTPITTYGESGVTERDIQSIFDHDERPHTITLTPVTDPEFATGVARQYLQRFSRPRQRWTSVSFVADGSGSGAALHYDALTQVQIGDRVRLRETWSGHDAEYAVVGEAHEVNAGSGAHRVTWTVKPAWADDYWTLQRDILDGELGISL